PRVQQVVALERDIVFPGPDAAERVARVNRHVDQVVVRGDPRVAALADSFAEAKNIEKPVEYVGFFGAPMPDRRSMSEESRPVLITAGGGARPQDIKLYEAAIGCADRSPLARHPWRLFIPIGTAPLTIDRLRGLAEKSRANVTVEPNASSAEFRQLMAD